MPTHLAPRFAGVLVGALSSVALYFVVRRATRSDWCGLLGGLTLAGFSQLARLTVTNLEPKALVVLLALLSFAALQRRRFRLAGLCAGLAPTCWQPAGLFSLSALAVAVWACRPVRRELGSAAGGERSGSWRWGPAIDLIAGGIVATLPTCVYLTLTGSWWEFWQRAFVIPAHMRGAGLSVGPFLWLEVASFAFASDLVFFAAAGLGFAWFALLSLRRGIRGVADAWLRPGLGGVPLATLLWVGFNARDFGGPPDMLPTLPLIAFWSAWLAWRGVAVTHRWLCRRGAPVAARRLARSAASLLLVAVPAYAYADAFLYQPEVTLPEVEAIVERIDAFAGPEGIVSGFDVSELYVLTGRKSPNRFLSLNLYADPVAFAPFVSRAEPEGCPELLDRVIGSSRMPSGGSSRARKGRICPSCAGRRMTRPERWWSSSPRIQSSKTDDVSHSAHRTRSRRATARGGCRVCPENGPQRPGDVPDGWHAACKRPNRIGAEHAEAGGVERLASRSDDGERFVFEGANHASSEADRLFARMPAILDLRDEACLEGLLATADALLGRSESIASLLELEWVLATDPGQWPLGAHVAVKLARSKAIVRARRRPLDLSVVVAVYAEHERMLRPFEHSLGEGFLDRKLRQLEWLVDGVPGARSDLWIVDDGCPHGSGQLAEEILRARHPRAAAHVLFLADAIRASHPVTRAMGSTQESRKGGAIQLGLYEATRGGRAAQIALFTDADLSTHLGQTGLLVEALDRPGVSLAIGSRRGPTSVVVKSGARSARGRLFIYLWKQLLPEIRYVPDTQCGFKALRGRSAQRLLNRPRIRNFAFDLELLVRAEHHRRRSIHSVPIAWIDSEAASTTVALAPYLSMLRSAVELHRSSGSGGARAEDFARAIESLSEPMWDRAVAILGPRLENCDSSLDVEALWVAPDELLAIAS